MTPLICPQPLAQNERQMKEPGYEKGYFWGVRRTIVVGLAMVFLGCVGTYFEQSQRPFPEKVSGIVDLIMRKSAERFLSDETLARNAGGPLLPRNLVKAAAENRLVLIGAALDAGLNINAHDYSLGMTLLHHAADKMNLELVTLLIERGADVNSKDRDHSTPLHFAAYKHGNIKIVNYLLQHGAVSDLVDDERLTPLDYANLAGDPEIISALSVTGGAAHGLIPRRKPP